MDALSRLPGVSQLRQQLSGARYSSLPRARDQGGDGEVLFQAEDDDSTPRTEQHPLSDRITRPSHPPDLEGADAELGEEVSDEHAAFVHEHASHHRPSSRRRRKAPGVGGVNVKVSTFLKVLAALGVLWGLWIGMKVAWSWFIAPKKNASDGMPAWSEGLGCDAAPYFYLNPSFESDASNHTIFHLPLTTSEGENTFLLRTQGANTALTLTLERQTDTTITDLVAQLAFSSPEPKMDFRLAGVGGSADSAPHLIYESLPSASYCIRMDAILFIPGNLHSLTLDLQTVSQVRVGDSWGNGRDAFSPFLRTLEVTLHADSDANLLWPSQAFTAEETKLSLAAGYLQGEIAIAQSLELAATPRGNVDLSAVVLSSQQGTGITNAALETHSGTGAFHLRVNNPGHERCLQAQLQSSGDLDLEFGGFLGTASWSAGNGEAVEGVGEGGEVGGGGCDTLRVNCGGRLDLTME